ncbi:MAG: MBOAT family O-acyltransferase [Myxococcaceae bacterium]
MLFHSAQFLAFFVAAFTVYWGLKRHRRARLAVLLLASGLFYAAWSPLPLLVFGWYAVVNVLGGRALERATGPRLRQAVVALVVLNHLAVLCTFKYADMLLNTWGWAAGLSGGGARPAALGLILPVGLSFIAFQAISYIVDVYRREVSGRYGLVAQLLYLLFFPQVVAGPIVRSRDLLERFDQEPQLCAEDGARGLFRIATGMAKKLLIADVLAVGLVDRVFENPALYSSTECALAAVAYTLQIYFDFSAYSDIAIGAAALFGFPLPENFNKPYHARNLFEFWSRWHVSLSSWLRDYLYIPLGGNRVSRPKVLRNLMVVMVLGGLWHGADWRFALWGGIHGVLLVGTRLWWWWRGKPREYSWASAALGIGLTFTVVVLSRIVFRAPDLPHALDFVRQLSQGSIGQANVSASVWVALAVAIAAYAAPARLYERLSEGFGWLPIPVRAMALVGLGLLVRQLASFELQPYIYFQF